MAKVLLVTGASRGIGAATARLAARRGWAVGVNYAGREDAARAVCEAIRAEGGDAVPLGADVSDEGQVRALFRACEAALGPVSGLVNNAGILGPAAPLGAIDAPRWRRIWAVNVEGTFLCCREALSRLGTGGAIVNLSSMAATLGGGGEFLDYAASKGAVESFTLGLAQEVGPRGIRVNAVRPGLIETDMQAASGDPNRARRLADTVALRRPGTAEEVAQAVVWLVSEEASYVTGAVLPVSGGR
jgi:NAD(P)-dependent dehydrogenase (short-subunit alcohol dehydrogenase family)